MNEFILSNGFDYLRHKIYWAYEHLKKFDSDVAAFCQSARYTVTRRDDLVNRQHIVRCEFPAVPLDFSMALSDVVYALRSGLDQLAWQLALLGTRNPSREVMFPILSENTPKSDDRFRRIVWDMPCEAVKVIKDLQPYNRGYAFRDDPLWQLNELSNSDKHRIPVGRAITSTLYIEPRGFTRNDLDYGVEVSWPLAVKDAVKLELKPPELVFGEPFDATNPNGLELRREDVARIYNYVRESVAPKFTSIFGAPPYP
jgi:hypothetical protein